MGKQKHFPHKSQPSLFDRIAETARETDPLPGSMDIDCRFRASLTQAIKDCPLSKELVAGHMSELTGREITLSKLDSWTAPGASKELHRFPAVFLPAFLAVTDSAEPLKVLGQPAKLYVMKSPDALMSEKAKKLDKINKLKAEVRRIDVLKKELEGRN